MKNLITILLLTSSLAMFGQDYATNESDLKRRKKEANGKIIAGVSVAIIGVLVITAGADNPDVKTVTDRTGGGLVGVGAVFTGAGIIEKIEIGKEERGKRRARNNKKQD